MTEQEGRELARNIVELGKKFGATDTEVQLAESVEFEVEIRMGEIEKLIQASSRSLSLRVTVDHRVAITTTSDLRQETLETLLRRSVERARIASEDPYAGPPDEFGQSVDPGELDLHDPALVELPPDRKIAMARETESIALKADPRISNSLGSWIGTAESRYWFANSRGIEGHFRTTHASLGLGLQAGDTDHRVEQYWWSSARHLEDLEPPEYVARQAVERTVRELNPRKLATTRADVIFEPRMTAQLLGFLASCLNGMLIYRNRSFLAGKLGEAVFGDKINIIDDGLRRRGLGSAPFDTEGVPTRTLKVVESGVLRSYLLNAYSARRLGLQTTGHAAGQGVSPHNFYLVPGQLEPEEIIRTTQRGLLLTRTIGHGTNPVTGEISKGAYGLWIEDGEIVYPASEITISGTLGEWLRNVDAIGNDLDFRGPVGGTTVRVKDVTIAGR